MVLRLALAGILLIGLAPLAEAVAAEIYVGPVRGSRYRTSFSYRSSSVSTHARFGSAYAVSTRDSMGEAEIGPVWRSSAAAPPAPASPCGSTGFHLVNPGRGEGACAGRR